MQFDLDQYRQDRGLTYAQLAEKLGLTQRRHAMRWARGESWPDADKLQRIVEITQGEVTVEAMHKRRLAFLASQKIKNVPAKSVAFRTRKISRKPVRSATRDRHPQLQLAAR